MSLPPFMGPFCPITGQRHSDTSVFCSTCNGRRAIPNLEIVDLTRSNLPGSPLVQRTASPRSRPTQNHLNSANARQQAREQQESQSLQADHAGASALGSRPTPELPQAKGNFKILTINTTLWWSTYKYVNKKSKIRRPNQRDEYIRKLAFV